MTTKKNSWGDSLKVDEKTAIGLDEAVKMVLENVRPLSAENIELFGAAGRVLAENVSALVDSPSVHASLKDGYAVVSADVDRAAPDTPVKLRQVGLVGAGDGSAIRVTSGTTVRVLTGAEIPVGADAVVAEEFVRVSGSEVTVRIDAEPGRNILLKGSDVEKGGPVAGRGDRVTPGLLGLLAAAGHSRLDVVQNPTVAIVATGDEVVAPGKELPKGKLYASNITTLAGWCRRYGFDVRLEIVKDDQEAISQVLEKFNRSADAVITSGGAWTGDRDLVAKVLEQLGWQRLFHRIRIGPGKAVGFGLLAAKPVFILPGGPPSNLMGFLQIALPGLLKLAGSGETSLPFVSVQVTEEFNSRFADWTQFIYGRLLRQSDQGPPVFSPLRKKSRLRSMAEADAIITIREGETCIPAGSVVPAQFLS